MAVVDSFLLCRKFMPKWRGQPDTESVFWKYVRVLLPQIGLDSNEDTSARGENRWGCVQVVIGKTQIKEGPKAGTLYAKQQRCKMCVANKRKEKKADGTYSKRSPRTAYTCICHPEEFMCKEGKGTCWEEHLAIVADIANNASSSSESD
jgi:hypothetical protein